MNSSSGQAVTVKTEAAEGALWATGQEAIVPASGQYNNAVLAKQDRINGHQRKW